MPGSLLVATTFNVSLTREAHDPMYRPGITGFSLMCLTEYLIELNPNLHQLPHPSKWVFYHPYTSVSNYHHPGTCVCVCGCVFSPSTKAPNALVHSGPSNFALAVYHLPNSRSHGEHLAPLPLETWL